MNYFDSILSELLNHPSTSTLVSVGGVTKKIKAFVHLIPPKKLKLSIKSK